MKILVIEDEPLIQKTLVKLLQKRGATVDATARGQEAIEKILLNSYDRIITDLMLQDITGFDIIEESKKKYSHHELKNIFIIITAYSSEAVLTRAASYGCKIIPKPFADLFQTIDEMLEGLKRTDDV